MRKAAFLFVLFAVPAVFAAVQFVDDFAQPDGPLTEWAQSIPIARIEGERLVLEPDPFAPNQPNVWAGKAGTPIFFGAMTSVACKVEFGPAPDADVGRHGGLIFCGKTPTHRYAPTFSGYFVDWIDRAADHGFRVFRVDNGVHVLLVQGTPAIAEPPLEWSIVFNDTGFELSADGTLVFDIADTTYRGGYFGCWCWSSIGQRMYVDDMVLELEASSCPLISPAAVRPRMGDPDVQFEVDAPFGANDSGPYRVTVTSSDPTVASVGGGASQEIVFEQGGALRKSFALQELKLGTTELRITANGAPCDVSMVPIEVVPTPSTRYLEDFTGESDGPPVDCFVASPDVTVLGEELHLMTMGAEPCAWIGYQGIPVSFSEIAKISCKIRFGTSASADIGRHGGIAFCSESPGSRWNVPNYMFDYLERDQTFRIGRGLANGTQAWPAVVGNRTDPGTEWSIELTGATMAFFVDGEKIVEVVDTERRSGYIGFWAYSNGGQELFVDDVEIIYTGAKCASITPSLVVVRPWYPTPVYTLAIPFGSNFSEDYTVTVTSARPDIAKLVGADGAGALALLFPAGGPITQTFEVECFDVPGTARLNVADRDASCTDIFAEVQVLELGAKAFRDDFAQADGAPEKWTVAGPDWQVVTEALTNVPTLSNEQNVWAGTPPIRFEMVERIACTLTFGDAPQDGVGRHGGIMFYARNATRRGLTNGYTIDWIDRVDPIFNDHGYRFSRWDNGVQSLVLPATLDLFAEPGTAWEVVFSGDEIWFLVDGELVFETVDASFRDGYIGAWAYQNNTALTIDDFTVGGEIIPSGPKFKRGDVNADNKVNIADAVSALGYLFTQGKVSCKDAVDVNDDGKLNIADPVTLLQYLFASGAPPPAPFDVCGEDTQVENPELGCESFAPCPQ